AEQLFWQGFELRTPRVDTVELAQVFYPTFEKYTLEHLAKALDLDLTDAHTAISDAYATAQLFLRLQAKINQLPKEVLEKLLPFCDNLIFETGMLIEAGFSQANPFSAATLQMVGDWVLRRPQTLSEPRCLSGDSAVYVARLGRAIGEKQAQVATLFKA